MLVLQSGLGVAALVRALELSGSDNVFVPLG